jgi:hypothetical protein
MGEFVREIVMSQNLSVSEDSGVAHEVLEHTIQYVCVTHFPLLPDSEVSPVVPVER